MKKITVIVAAILLVASLAFAQEAKSKAAAGESGKDLFAAHCGACHGADAHGNGAATPALKKVPPDLTKLAAAAGGKYPATKVHHVIQGDPDLPAHGSKSMPVWGTIFLEQTQRDRAKAQQRIQSLVEYIGTLQGK